MERLIDKTIVFVCCLASLMLVPFSSYLVISLLLALIACLSAELRAIPARLSLGALLVYLCLALIWPSYILFIPLVVYDLFKRSEWFLRACWIVPLAVGLVMVSLNIVVVTAAICVITCILSWRTKRVEQERTANTLMRDELRETSLALEHKNSDLLEKQDYEVKLAMLNERSRIAREIHDNVGHLLTRSVLQVEAIQVIHSDNESIKKELAQLGSTLHEAYDTIRHSVHDLHDDAFDLQTQLLAVIRSSPTLQIDLDYQVDVIEQKVGYSVLAIVREALANTAKHSDATKMSIALIENPSFYRLTVHDNGSMNPFQRRRDIWDNSLSLVNSNSSAFIEECRGIGLKTMEERARTLGGLFRIDYEKGFKVFVSVPKDEQGETNL